MDHESSLLCDQWEMMSTLASEDLEQVRAQLVMRSSSSLQQSFSSESHTSLMMRGSSLQQSLSSESLTSPTSFLFPCDSSSDSQLIAAGFADRSSKLQKVNYCWNFCNDNIQRLPLIEDDPSLPFRDQKSPIDYGRVVKPREQLLIRKYEPVVLQQRSVAALETSGSPVSPAQEHIMAERKRREKMNQKFIELSAIIPGLKKADKASVLSDAVRYVKELEVKVKTLEEKSMERTVESVVLVKKSELSINNGDDAGSLGDINNDNISDSRIRSEILMSRSFPEIEAKLAKDTILVRIHCDNKKGVLVQILTELEKLHLTTSNINVMPFIGSSSLNITITTQIEEEFSSNLKELVRRLQAAVS